MTAIGFEMWAGSPIWRAAGEAMLDFLFSGAIAGLVFAMQRRVSGRLPATVRYFAACSSLVVLVGLAGFHAWNRWPAAAIAMTPVSTIADDASSSAMTAPTTSHPQPSITPAATAVSPPGGQRFSWELWKPRLVQALPFLWLIGAPLTALFVGLGWTGAARLRTTVDSSDE